LVCNKVKLTLLDSAMQQNNFAVAAKDDE
jgi:hypothetical protein